MSADVSPGSQRTPPAGGTEVVAVLSRFREALMAGQRPRIEDLLPDSSGTGHSPLLRGLVTLEVAYRRRRGERPTVQEYRARFPGQDQAIQEAFHHPVAKPTATAAPAAVVKIPSPRDEGATDRLPPLDAAAQPYDLASHPDAARQLGDYQLLERIC